MALGAGTSWVETLIVVRCGRAGTGTSKADPVEFERVRRHGMECIRRAIDRTQQLMFRYGDLHTQVAPCAGNVMVVFVLELIVASPIVGLNTLHQTNVGKTFESPIQCHFVDHSSHAVEQILHRTRATCAHQVQEHRFALFRGTQTGRIEHTPRVRGRVRFPTLNVFATHPVRYVVGNTVHRCRAAAFFVCYAHIAFHATVSYTTCNLLASK